MLVSRTQFLLIQSSLCSYARYFSFTASLYLHLSTGGAHGCIEVLAALPPLIVPLPPYPTSHTHYQQLFPHSNPKAHYSPRLCDWPLEVKPKEALPDQRQHGMIHLCSHGLIGPTINREARQKRCP